MYKNHKICFFSYFIVTMAQVFSTLKVELIIYLELILSIQSCMGDLCVNFFNNIGM